MLKTRNDTKAKPGEHPDRSLADMFDLMFHGTTDDIHRKYDKNNPLMRADDARFPYGFFINPDISIVLLKNSRSLKLSASNPFSPMLI